MTAEQTAKNIAEILENKKAHDVRIIDVEGKTILADRFVIATGQSVTHIRGSCRRGGAADEKQLAASTGSC